MKINVKNFWINIVLVGMVFGTAWAVRGQFGHEQGAAWAGAIGSFGLVLVANRKDWFRKIYLIGITSAIGWGIGGIISYGRVVGYGRSDDLPNAFYGLLMLFVIGGLFGLLGGGLTGLSLESTKDKKVKWASLITEMVAGALIVYGFLIMQLGIKMTPPRSEAWAFCLGAGIAMLWHMARNGWTSSVRVAIFASFGAGFGFAFGNFLQILGNVLNIPFNMWNVMEYNIGFWGGTAMAYGIFTSKWPENTSDERYNWEKIAAFLFVLFFIPMIVFKESLLVANLADRFKNSSITDSGIFFSSVVALVFILATIVVNALLGYKKSFHSGRNEVMVLFYSFFLLYIALSFIATGIFAGEVHSNHVLYVLNWLIVLLIVRRNAVCDFNLTETKFTNIIRTWPKLLTAIILLIFILAFVAINIHGEMSGAHNRFAR